jgi:Cft2 family RNA processing exonuclease
MVRLNDILYTGDINPEGGLTSGKATPGECEILIIEATYGKPSFKIPPRQEVVQSILDWSERELARRPIAIAGYELGKAQELIAILNKLPYPVFVSEEIYRISEVYLKYGVRLKFKRISDMMSGRMREPYALVVPRRMLNAVNDSAMIELRRNGGRTCYVSGWCAFRDYTSNSNIDYQFPLSDHADFDDLIWFIDQCSPKRVYTVYGSPRNLSRAVRSRLGIPAEALREH